MYRYSLHWPSVCNRSCCRLWRSLWDRWPLRRGNKKKKKENGISNEVTTLCNTEQHNQRGGSATTAAPELNGVVMETRTRRGPGRAPGVEIATDRAQRGEKEEKMGGAISPLARDTVQYSTNRNFFLFFSSPKNNRQQVLRLLEKRADLQIPPQYASKWRLFFFWTGHDSAARSPAVSDFLRLLRVLLRLASSEGRGRPSSWLILFVWKVFFSLFFPLLLHTPSSKFKGRGQKGKEGIKRERKMAK